MPTRAAGPAAARGSRRRWKCIGQSSRPARPRLGPPPRISMSVDPAVSGHARSNAGIGAGRGTHLPGSPDNRGVTLAPAGGPAWRRTRRARRWPPRAGAAAGRRPRPCPSRPPFDSGSAARGPVEHGEPSKARRGEELCCAYQGGRHVAVAARAAREVQHGQAVDASRQRHGRRCEVLRDRRRYLRRAPGTTLQIAQCQRPGRGPHVAGRQAGRLAAHPHERLADKRGRPAVWHARLERDTPLGQPSVVRGDRFHRRRVSNGVTRPHRVSYPLYHAAHSAGATELLLSRAACPPCPVPLPRLPLPSRSLHCGLFRFVLNAGSRPEIYLSFVLWASLGALQASPRPLLAPLRCGLVSVHPVKRTPLVSKPGTASAAPHNRATLLPYSANQIRHHRGTAPRAAP